jgi:hypothetical protein
MEHRLGPRNHPNTRIGIRVEPKTKHMSSSLVSAERITIISDERTRKEYCRGKDRRDHLQTEADSVGLRRKLDPNRGIVDVGQPPRMNRRDAAARSSRQCETT